MNLIHLQIGIPTLMLYTSLGYSHRPWAKGHREIVQILGAKMVISRIFQEQLFVIIRICFMQIKASLCQPTQNPNASQWNIGCDGFQTKNSCIGHISYCLCQFKRNKKKKKRISFASSGQRKHSFSGEYGL